MQARDDGRGREAGVPQGTRPRTAAPPAPASLPLAASGTALAAAVQRLAGNAAMTSMVQREREQHEHGPGCGHQDAAERPSHPASVQRRTTAHQVLRDSGTSIAGPLRKEMEARLGADFSDVRLHTDAAARASAAELGARAYTSGSHVVLGDGGHDKVTLAHELTHVIQQRQGSVAGTDNGAGLWVSDPNDRFEQAAEANARAVMARPAP